MENKKITIRHFLNKRLKPQVLGSEEYYPLYTQVTYDRKNTQFKMNMRFDHFIEEGFKGFFEREKIASSIVNDQKFLKEYILDSIEWREKMIELSLRHEIEIQKGQFVLKGFGKRFSFYEKDLWKVFHTHCLELLYDSLIGQVSLSQLNVIKEYKHFVYALKYIKLNFRKVYLHFSESHKTEITCFHLFHNFISFFGQTPKLKSSLTDQEKNHLGGDFKLNYGVTLEYHVFEWLLLDGRNKFKGYCNTKLTHEAPEDFFKTQNDFTNLKKEFPPEEHNINKYLEFIDRMITKIEEKAK